MISTWYQSNRSVGVSLTRIWSELRFLRQSSGRRCGCARLLCAAAVFVKVVAAAFVRCRRLRQGLRGRLCAPSPFSSRPSRSSPSWCCAALLPFEYCVSLPVLVLRVVIVLELLSINRDQLRRYESGSAQEAFAGFCYWCVKSRTGTRLVGG